MNRHFSIFSAIGFCILSLSLNISAQSEVDDQDVEPSASEWFQVELLVFSQQSSVESSEEWPVNLALFYPELTQVPFDNESWDRDALSRLAHYYNEDEFQRLLVGDRNMPKAFFMLPPSALNATKYTLNRRNAYKVLFHQAWIQPFQEGTYSPSILIQGGKQFNNHFELSGTVRISLDHYLHFQSDLWLSEFEENLGQETAHWPELPTAPTHPEKIDQPAIDPQLTIDESSFGSRFYDASRLEGYRAASDITEALAQPSINLDKHLFRQFEQENESQPFITRNIVTIRQKRRMRSTELHYFDHPKAGILIKITPHEIPVAPDIPEVIPANLIEKQEPSTEPGEQFTAPEETLPMTPPAGN